MEHFGAVFKLDLTEETMTQLQEKGGNCFLLPILWLRLWDMVQSGNCRSVMGSHVAFGFNFTRRLTV